MALTGPAYYGNKYLEDIAREQNIGAVYGYLIDDTDNSISKISGNQVLEKYMPGDEAYQATVRTNLDSAARGTFQEYLDTYFPGGTLREDLQAPRPKLTQAQADIEQENRDAYMEQQQENRQEGPQVKRYSDKDLSSMRASGELTPGGTRKDYLRSIGQDKQSKEARRKAALPSSRLAAKKEAEQGGGGSSGNLDVITDPVTGQMFSRDLSIPGSTYQPYAGDPAYNPSSTIAPPNQTYSSQSGQQPPPALEDIFGKYGFNISPAASYQFKVAPAASWKEVYTSLTDELGLSKVKKQIDKTVKDMGKLDQELADKIADVNENPWLSEGVRVSQIRKLEERYDLKRAPYAANLTTLENLWNDGREEARYVATQALQQYNQDREFQLDQIQFMQDQAEKQMDAAIKLYELSNKEQDYGPGVIGEFQYLNSLPPELREAFIAFQNEDANRKRQNINLGLTPYQTGQTFLNISNKYQADPFINVALKGQNAIQVADQVISDPKNATNQLKALYSLVKNLDADSAVREGELALATKTQSYYDEFSNSLARISEGRVISPDAATKLAQATKELAVAWNDTARRRTQQYQSQANIAGVGQDFGAYVGGSGLDFGGGPVAGGDQNDPLGIR